MDFLLVSTLPHWSNSSMVYYLILGFIAAWAVYFSKKSGYPIKSIICNPYYIVWWLLWTISATYRLVGINLGGTDSLYYISFFHRQIDEHLSSDILFKYYNQFLSFFTDDYHFFFFITYGLIAFVTIKFIDKFCPRKFSAIPFILTFFFFWRGWLSLRSHLAIIIILSGCLLLLKGRWKSALLVAFLSMFVHKSAILYAMVVPFVVIFKKKELKIKYVVILILLSMILGMIFRTYFIQYTSDEMLGGAYTSYVANAMEKSFFENTWKIAFEQMLLGAAILLFLKKVNNYFNSCSTAEKDKMQIIWLICIYDFMLIPINCIMGIWRGYEYFYLPRLIFWSLLTYFTLQMTPKGIRSIVSFLCLVCFVAWMVFRVYNTWEDSGLMPYIFEPFRYL